MGLHQRYGDQKDSYAGGKGNAWRPLPWHSTRLLSTAGLAALVACVSVGATLVGARVAAAANPTLSVVTASTAQTATTNADHQRSSNVCARHGARWRRRTS